MVCVTEVFDWFKESPAHLRLDFIYNIMQLCLPNELRYFTTILEDMNNKDYGMLREIEERSNLDDEFRQLPHFALTTEVVHKLCLRLSLLKSSNQKVAQAIYEILRIHFEYANTCMSNKNELSNEILLMYTMARFHPAFTFKNKLKLSKFLSILLSNFDSTNEEKSVSKDSNNNCSISKEDDYADVMKSSVKITDVSIDKDDAKLTIEFKKHNNSDQTKIKCISNYTEIRNFIYQLISFDSTSFVSQIHKTVQSLSKNGSFNSSNIKRVLTESLDALIRNKMCLSDDIIKYLENYPSIETKELAAEKEILDINSIQTDTANHKKVSVIKVTNPISGPIKLKEKKHSSPNRKPVVISVNTKLNQSIIDDNNNKRVNDEHHNKNNDLCSSSQTQHLYNTTNQINNNSTSQVRSNNELSQQYYESLKSQNMSSESPPTTTLMNHHNYSMTHSDISMNQRSAFYGTLNTQAQKYSSMCSQSNLHSNTASSCCLSSVSTQPLPQSLYTTPLYGAYPTTDTTLTPAYQASNTSAPNYLVFGYSHPYYPYSLFALTHQQSQPILMTNQSGLVNDCSNDNTSTNNAAYSHNHTTTNTNNNSQIHHSNYTNTPTNTAPFIGFMTSTHHPYFTDQSSTTTPTATTAIINNNQVPLSSSNNSPPRPYTISSTMSSSTTSTLSSSSLSNYVSGQPPRLTQNNNNNDHNNSINENSHSKHVIN